MARSKKQIALAIDPDWPFKHHFGVVNGVLAYAKTKDWECRFDPFLGTKAWLERRILYDGAIARATTEMANFAKKNHLPTVNVWFNSPDRTLPRVMPDMATASRKAAAHLLDTGVRRFGFLNLLRNRSSAIAKSTFVETVAGAGHECSVRSIPVSSSTPRAWESIQGTLEEWVASWSFPIGIFTWQDKYARLLADICAHRGLRVPDDVLLVGCGNTSLVCEAMDPTLTSIEMDYAHVGYSAAELLDKLISGKPAPKDTIISGSPEIIPRRSTDVVAVEDRVVAAALRYIWDNNSSPIQVDDVIESLPVSRRSLERRFRREIGRTIHGEIIHARVEKAKRLMQESEYPLKTIAAEAGFSSLEHLCKVFRKSESITPGEYRKKHSSP